MNHKESVKMTQAAILRQPTSHKTREKLTGRAFYESLGSPKMILAPMVDQSEFVGAFVLSVQWLCIDSVF